MVRGILKLTALGAKGKQVSHVVEWRPVWSNEELKTGSEEGAKPHGEEARRLDDSPFQGPPDFCSVGGPCQPGDSQMDTALGQPAGGKVSMW